MIQVKEIKDKSQWEKFNLASANPTFLQSWSWGDFQKSLNRKIYRLGIFDEQNLVGTSLLVEEKAKIGSFLYCPGGPVLKEWNEEVLNKWLEYVADLAKKEDSVFLRIEPRYYYESAKETLLSLGFVDAPAYSQPRCTVILDLSKDEGKILSNMSDSTRYNIGAAQRKGVKIREGKKEEIKVFENFLQNTARRKTFTLPAERGYHKKQFEILEKGGLMKLFIAEHEGTPLAAALVLFYADSAYYLHAATSSEKSKLRMTYPLVWRSIMEADKRDLKKFDFWGAAENDDPSHPWAGVTSFKLSFGGAKVCYESPLDLPYKSNYQLMKVVEIWRKPIRKILRFGR